MKTLMLVARALAVAIAIAAVVDPVFTSARRTRPEIALITTGAAQSERTADEVLKQLDKRYTVVRAPFANAAATVSVGNTIPAELAQLASPLFVVPVAAGVTIEAVNAPRSASLEARIPVRVDARANAGSAVIVTLSMGGLIVDRVTRAAGAAGRVSVPLSFVPTAAGPAALRVTAIVTGGRDSVIADLLVDVRADRWAVLFFDRRPSWMSTFVRRSLEADRRFVIASRVMTSRGISTEAGSPPSSLEDPTLLELYDAIVVGAPEAMTSRDAAGLETFLRRRGGGVVLLFDERPSASGSYQQLTGAGRWSGATNGTPWVVAPVAGDSGGLRATELMWAEAMPGGSEILAKAMGAQSQPVVWSLPVGSGQLIVNGALDSWKFREAETSAFDAFWRTTIGASASRALPAVQLQVAHPVVAPGELIEASLRVRDAFLARSDQSARTGVAVRLDSTAVRMWPGDRVGELAGTVRAPLAEGVYRMVATANGSSTEIPILVHRQPGRPERDDRDMLAAIATSRGGKVTSIGELNAALSAAVVAKPRMERWYPMRAAWWIVPFVGLLGLEWLWRRRRGLA